MLIILLAIQEGGNCYFVPGFFEKIDQRSTESRAFMGLTELRSKATVWGECGKVGPWEPTGGHSEPERAFTDSVTATLLCLLPSKKKKQAFPDHSRLCSPRTIPEYGTERTPNTWLVKLSTPNP